MGTSLLMQTFPYPEAAEVPPLANGDRLTRAEFLRRWDALPNLKHVELIGGIVYRPSPGGADHSSMENTVTGLVGTYCARTPGTSGGNGSTLLMLDDAAQADVHLRIDEEYGGQTKCERGLLTGAPELCAEICFSASAYDLHQKKDLYEAAGVREFLAVLMWEKEIRLHRLGRSGYSLAAVPSDGILRSAVFPGLWINTSAMLEDNAAAALNTLEAGLKSPKHAEFVRTLAERKVER